MVEPIRQKNKVEQLQNYLKGKNYRDFLLFSFGLNTGLRISDIIKLKVSDLLTDKMQFRQYLTIKEKKTKKEKRIKLNNKLKEYIRLYLAQSKGEYNAFLFGSRKGGALSRIQAYRILKDGADALGVENFGTHTMRKTFGYFIYQQTKNIGLLMDLFNHSSQKITLKYIGINQDQQDDIYSRVQF